MPSIRLVAESNSKSIVSAGQPTQLVGQVYSVDSRTFVPRALTHQDTDSGTMGTFPLSKNSPRIQLVDPSVISPGIRCWAMASSSEPRSGMTHHQRCVCLMIPPFARSGESAEQHSRPTLREHPRMTAEDADPPEPDWWCGDMWCGRGSGRRHRWRRRTRWRSCGRRCGAGTHVIAVLRAVFASADYASVIPHILAAVGVPATHAGAAVGIPATGMGIDDRRLVRKAGIVGATVAGRCGRRRPCGRVGWCLRGRKGQRCGWRPGRCPSWR